MTYILPGVLATPVIPQFIYSTTAAITVTATAGTANQVYVSAAISGI